MLLYDIANNVNFTIVYYKYPVHVCVYTSVVVSLYIFFTTHLLYVWRIIQGQLKQVLDFLGQSNNRSTVGWHKETRQAFFPGFLRSFLQLLQQEKLSILILEFPG